MKKILVLLTLLTAFGGSAQQTPKMSIAVSKPFVKNLSNYDDVTLAKLIQLELIKLNLYSVYDEFDMAEAFQQ